MANEKTTASIVLANFYHNSKLLVRGQAVLLNAKDTARYTAAKLVKPVEPVEAAEAAEPAK
jgi:hypothetical protein